MAFDGLTIYTITQELNTTLIGGRIDKIYQPEKDEIVLSIRNNGTNYRLLMTSHANNPRIHFTAFKKGNPLQAPMFCMLLRKHFAGAKITQVRQINFDRIMIIDVDGKNEMGDSCSRSIIIEIMGKHSNIILLNEFGKIIDCIKHVTPDVSSKRIVMPGQEYTLPPHNKLNPLEIEDFDSFNQVMSVFSLTTERALIASFNGVSPIIAREICFISNTDNNIIFNALSRKEREEIFEAFLSVFSVLREQQQNKCIIRHNDKMIDFSPIPLKQYTSSMITYYDDLSQMLEYYYHEKDVQARIKQKAYDLNKLLHNNLERAQKKLALQSRQLNDTKNRDIFKLKGELLTANIYAIKKGMTKIECVNYYSDEQETITIALDPNKSPSENAQKFFKKYNKAKRTSIALDEQIKITAKEVHYLESISNALSLAKTESDLMEIRKELFEQGYIRKMKKVTKNMTKSAPMHYVSSEGLKILVGKNNLQNDHLTFKMASTEDLWFHIKDMPGSHTVLFVKGEEYTDQSILEAAEIAAFYSKAKQSSNVPIDYTKRKYVKKPNGSKPGFVIYTDQKTVFVTPEENEIKKLEKH